MRLGPVASNPIELIAVKANLFPRPLMDTQMAFTLARLVMVGTKLGVYDALAAGPRTAQQVAEDIETDPAATEKLLFALAGAGYTRAVDGGYGLTAVSRKWLVSDSKSSLGDKLLFQFLEWDLMERAEDYVRTGEPLEIHSAGGLGEADWDLYQRGMLSMAKALAGEAVRRMPVPKGATTMLDIGGSHGYFSVGLCRKHAGLTSEVLDLPEAIAKAAPLLAAENMGERVAHVADDALTRDLGTEAYDLVLIANLVHHFSERENRDLAGRVARALRPDGVFAILDATRPRTPKEAGQLGALLEFYFSLTSQSGTWSVQEMAGWQQDAGLSAKRSIGMRTIPGVVIQAAVKN